MSEPQDISRRRLLQLAAASLVVLSGCSILRPTAELDEAREELRNLLREIADGEAEEVRLLAIAHRIDTRANELGSEHTAFTENFNKLAANRDVTSDHLTNLVTDYETRRVWLRDDLLRLQDELQAALSDDDWNGVQRIMNRKGEAIAGKAERAG